MIKASKSIISLAENDLACLEKKNALERYEKGYKNKPESIDEIKAMEKLSADAFNAEDLKLGEQDYGKICALRVEKVAAIDQAIKFSLGL